MSKMSAGKIERKLDILHRKYVTFLKAANALETESAREVFLKAADKAHSEMKYWEEKLEEFNNLEYLVRRFSREKCDVKTN